MMVLVHMKHLEIWNMTKRNREAAEYRGAGLLENLLTYWWGW